MLVIHIEGLNNNFVTHRANSNVWDDTYQPCQADNEITEDCRLPNNSNLTLSICVQMKRNALFNI